MSNTLIILLVIADLVASLRIHLLQHQIKNLNERINKLEDKSDS